MIYGEYKEVGTTDGDDEGDVEADAKSASMDRNGRGKSEKGTRGGEKSDKRENTGEQIDLSGRNRQKPTVVCELSSVR
ncbi:hypothetical protein [Natrinema salsiterrestre]|uniref:Uncharacterized protein n=1 Tax=Natrinema salsiterrestre TaxID=2950540 RepID=A0A9Q4KZR8_9EURY|nr:hypothetical protein [Natrinema salsiterrestre]MDF9747098.1 hypothetical protein [Natrinema salsiterrestre]